MDFTDKIKIHAEDVTRLWPVSSWKLKNIAFKSAKCQHLSLVCRFVKEGWLNYEKMIQSNLYLAAQACLSTFNGIMTYLVRIFFLLLFEQTCCLDFTLVKGFTKIRDIASTSVLWHTI